MSVESFSVELIINDRHLMEINYKFFLNDKIFIFFIYQLKCMNEFELIYLIKNANDYFIRGLFRA